MGGGVLRPRDRLLDAVRIDKDEARAAVEAAAAQTAQLIRAIPDPTRRAHGLAWTVGETATHLVWVTRGYALWASGRGAPEWDLDRLADTNARLIDELPERRPAELADLFAAGALGFLEATAQLPGDRPVPWFGGHTLSLASATCMMLEECLVHGYDIATTIGRPWPIATRHACLAVDGITSILPLTVDPRTAAQVTATYAIRVRGGSRFVVRFRGGALTVEPLSAAPVDCHISADPVAFLLVGMNRVSQWRAIARGQLVAWGRKPWLGVKYRSFLRHL